MHIPTRFGRTLAHPTCSWYCQGDIHAIITAGPSEACEADVEVNATALGLDVVEVLPAREVELAALRHRGEQFDGQHIHTQGMQADATAWIVRCRVAAVVARKEG